MSRRSSVRVQGYCPMGCGQSLIVSEGGYIVCGHLECPDPEAVTNILADRETEHLVTFSEHDFTIWHPLRERIGAALLRCELHARLQEMGYPPVEPGTYRARQRPDGGYSWGRYVVPT